jgi:GGDEF domain-containing protein
MNLVAHNSQSDRGYKISLSTGLARYDPQHPRSIDELLSEADTSMYVNKKKRQQE